MTPEIVLFLDVDGTVLPEEEENGNRTATVQRTIKTITPSKTVGNFAIPPITRTHIIEETLVWREELAQFLRTIQPKVKIVWLTGWKQNAKIISDTLGLTWTGFLDWEVTNTEAGKIAAIEQFINSNPNSVFIWADDFAPIKNLVPNFIVPHLTIIPDKLEGITDQQLTQMGAFITQHAG